ncbi:MAG: helix-turn-helix domain-containing protein [Pseudomonadota bacterium]
MFAYTSAVLSGPLCGMLNLDWHKVMAHAGLGLADRDDNGFLVSAAEYLQLWTAMMELTRQLDVAKFLGLRMASGPAIPVLFAMSSAPDFETGVTRLSAYKSLFGPMAFNLERTSDAFTVRVTPSEQNLSLPPTFSSPQIVYLHAKTMALARHRFLPQKVSVPLPRAEREDLSDVFGMVPDDGTPTLSYRIADASVPFVSANPELWEATEADLQSQALIQANEADVADRVRAVMLEAFSVTDPTLAHVCARLGMSRSTLLRRLAAEGATFQALLDETRKDVALRYLKKSDLNNQQISHLVGYRDPNAFQRAFRKWTGKTPLELRAKHNGRA